MLDINKLWSCAGSAGTVNVADVSKVDFVGSIVKLHGVDIEPPRAAKKLEPEIKINLVEAIIRYGVTPVDGLSATPNDNAYALRVLSRKGRGSNAAAFLLASCATCERPHGGCAGIFAARAGGLIRSDILRAADASVTSLSPINRRESSAKNRCRNATGRGQPIVENVKRLKSRQLLCFFASPQMRVVTDCRGYDAVGPRMCPGGHRI